ncbi:hypothetical protein ACJX0J_009600, partial [Zea mays]
ISIMFNVRAIEEMKKKSGILSYRLQLKPVFILAAAAKQSKPVARAHEKLILRITIFHLRKFTGIAWEEKIFVRYTKYLVMYMVVKFILTPSQNSICFSVVIPAAVEVELDGYFSFYSSII